MADDIKIWECEKGSGHVMGLVKKNGRGVSFLVLYRNTVDHHAEQPAEVDVMGVVHNGEQFRCQICGKVRAWVPNQMAFEELMEHYKGRESSKQEVAG